MSEEELELLDYTFDLAIGECYSDEIDEISKLQKKLKRLNNIINELERLVDDYAWNSYYIKCGNRYLKSEILNDIREIIELKGSDKE